MTAFSDETGREPFQSPQHIIEGIILRRLHDKRIEGYTLEMSKEIEAALSASPVAQEPVAYQYRACIAGKWGDWTDLHQSVEGFRNGPWKFGLENGTCELRALYAGTPPATPAGLGADEIARAVEALKPFANFCDKYQRMPETMVITNGSPYAKKQLTIGDCYRAFDALALLSRAGDQGNSTQKDGSR